MELTKFCAAKWGRLGFLRSPRRKWIQRRRLPESWLKLGWTRCSIHFVEPFFKIRTLIFNTTSSFENVVRARLPLPCARSHGPIRSLNGFLSGRRKVCLPTSLPRKINLGKNKSFLWFQCSCAMFSSTPPSTQAFQTTCTLFSTLALPPTLLPYTMPWWRRESLWQRLTTRKLPSSLRVRCNLFLHELLLHLLLARHTAEAEHILAPHSDDGFGYDVWLRSLSSRKAIEMAIAAYGTRNLALLFRRSSTTPPGIHCCLTARSTCATWMCLPCFSTRIFFRTRMTPWATLHFVATKVLRAVLDTQDPDVIFAALLHGCFPWHSELRSVAEALAADASPEQKSLPRATTAPPQAFCDFLNIAQVAFLHRDPSDYEPPHPKGEDDDNAHTSIWLPLSE